MSEPLDSPELENWFSYHPPANEAVATLHEFVRSECLGLAVLLNDVMPPCDEGRQALDAVRLAMMWANAAIACHAADDPVLGGPDRIGVVDELRRTDGGIELDVTLDELAERRHQSDEDKARAAFEAGAKAALERAAMAADLEAEPPTDLMAALEASLVIAKHAHPSAGNIVATTDELRYCIHGISRDVPCDRCPANGRSILDGK